MKKILNSLKNDIVLVFSLAVAILSFFISKPTLQTLSKIDWRTLGILLMMLCVLCGFKKENIFQPILNLCKKFKNIALIIFFLVFGVFFTSMFVTNDVSLIIFVPLTISIFKLGQKENLILPTITLENIAAVRGSLLTPFGSPQNLFLYGKSGSTTLNFMLHMSPLCISSGILLSIFILIMQRKNLHETIVFDTNSLEISTNASKREEDARMGKKRKVIYLCLFTLILFAVVSRTRYWYIILLVTLIAIFFTDAMIYRQIDYVLIITFLCFFIFSSSVTSNVKISQALSSLVANNEYWWAIGLSQIMSNVPASIILYPFSKNFAGLIYGLDTAGLVSIIGSLASVINYRLYVKEYPKNGKKFIKCFTLINWAFFSVVVIPTFYLSKWSFV